MKNYMEQDGFSLKMFKEMFCSICEHLTCDSCFVPEFAQFIGKMNECETCVLCKGRTPFRLGDSVGSRRFYIEGAGQLCETCFNQINSTN